MKRTFSCIVGFVDDLDGDFAGHNQIKKVAHISFFEERSVSSNEEMLCDWTDFTQQLVLQVLALKPGNLLHIGE